MRELFSNFDFDFKFNSIKWQKSLSPISYGVSANSCHLMNEINQSVENAFISLRPFSEFLVLKKYLCFAVGNN